jgi:predicted amidophosphoribosyltransferase
MDANCSKCGSHIATMWGFCPHCGNQIKHEVHPQDHEHHPARGAFGGMFYGLIAAPILIFPGIMLCLLGWGIFFGVPMIVLGLLAPLAGPIFGMNEHRAKCPSCGTHVLTLADGKTHRCPTCSESFAVGKVETASVTR